MKNNIDDATIQAAIDEACLETAEAHPYTSQLLTLERYRGSDYDREAPARLALARALLARLPEPQPPVVDGLIAAARGPINLEAAVGATPGSFAKTCDDPKTGELPTPATFEAHGKTWTRHTPGDPMPCDKDARIYFITNSNATPSQAVFADDCCWNASTKIIGWRYADEPTPEPAQPWQPAVGDKVKLKGGSFTMTVEQADSDGIACEWHDSNGVPQVRTYTPSTLQPA